mgnify:CR=1 FL=1
MADIFGALFGGFSEPVPPKGMKPKKGKNNSASNDFFNNVFGGF